MNRILSGLAILGLALVSIGCGGSKADLPSGGGGNQLTVDLISPDRISGGHSVSIVPDQLSVLTGASESELRAVVARYGYTVLHKSGGYATLQLPAGTDLDVAAAELVKEYVIATAEPVRVINTPTQSYMSSVMRGASYLPADPFYGEQMNVLGFDGANFGTFRFIGQGLPMSIIGMDAAYDISLRTTVATQPVTIAIIDAGYLDYSTPGVRPGFNDAILDPVNSGSVTGAGVFTAGLAAATFDTFDHDADGTTPELPIRNTGETMLGMLAADIDSIQIQAADLDGLDSDTPPDGNLLDQNEIWNEGIAGMNPNASYIIIKTGTEVPPNPPSQPDPTWSFSDAEIAESVDHAVAAGANIILLGMFGTGVVSANLATSLQNARDNDVLVVAPAGDVASTFDGTTFTGTAADVSTVTPASDPNVLSVSGVGANRVSALGDVDFSPAGPGPEDIPNIGQGYFPMLGAPVDDPWFRVASYSNTGAEIAAPIFGLGFGFHPFLVNGTDLIPAQGYQLTLDRFSTSVSAAYVAGVASICYQAWSASNGLPPTVVELENELLTSALLQDSVNDFTGLNPGLAPGAGIVAAATAVGSSIAGGGLISTEPALEFTSIIASQAFLAVTRGTDFSLTPTIQNGTAPFTIEIDWDNGAAPAVVDPWTNGTPVTLTGGYDQLGSHSVNITVTDDNGLTENIGVEIKVINPIAASVTILDAAGLVKAGNPIILTTGQFYDFISNAANVYTGDVNGIPNVTTFSWDLDGDGAEDATGPTVSKTIIDPTPGAVTLRLTISESAVARPASTFDVQVDWN